MTGSVAQVIMRSGTDVRVYSPHSQSPLRAGLVLLFSLLAREAILDKAAGLTEYRAPSFNLYIRLIEFSFVAGLLFWRVVLRPPILATRTSTEYPFVLCATLVAFWWHRFLPVSGPMRVPAGHPIARHPKPRPSAVTCRTPR